MKLRPEVHSLSPEEPSIQNSGHPFDIVRSARHELFLLKSVYYCWQPSEIDPLAGSSPKDPAFDLQLVRRGIPPEALKRGKYVRQNKYDLGGNLTPVRSEKCADRLSCSLFHRFSKHLLDNYGTDLPLSRWGVCDEPAYRIHNGHTHEDRGRTALAWWPDGLQSQFPSLS